MNQFLGWLYAYNSVNQMEQGWGGRQRNEDDKMTDDLPDVRLSLDLWIEAGGYYY